MPRLAKRPSVGRAGKRSAPKIPELDASKATVDDFLEVYRRSQIVIVRGCDASSLGGSGETRAGRARVDMRTLRAMYSEFPKVVNRAFYVERPPKGASRGPSSSADVMDRLLGSARQPRGPWYASFVVQRNRAAMSSFFRAMPFKVPPFLQRKLSSSRGKVADVRHSEAAWVFFGTNPTAQPLRGRAEHTDDIQHNGTWHVQLQGSKVWTLRPTTELLRKNRSLRTLAPVKVRCDVGDVLCVNTRLWWHQTYIPAGCRLSLSVARDMFLDGRKPDAPDFTNIRGHYATRVFPKGAVVFTEDEAPNLELPRSKTSNCGVRDSGGELLVVAKRRIQPGEWFSVSASESDGEDDKPPVAKRRKS